MSDVIFAGDERVMIVKFKRLLALCQQRMQQLEKQLQALQNEQAARQLELRRAEQKYQEMQLSRKALLDKWAVTTGAAPDSHLAQKRAAYIDSVNTQVQVLQKAVTESQHALDTATERLQEVRGKLQRQSARHDQLEAKIVVLSRQLERNRSRRAEGLVEERYCRRKMV